MAVVLITDASVLINLVASGAATEILAGCGWRFHVCQEVLAEVKMLRDRETGEEHPIDLSPLLTAGLLTLIEPELEEEFELLIEYSALVGAGKGEAMCFALAEARNIPIAIDDVRAVRKARRRNPAIETIDTITILKQWHKKLGNSNEKIGTLMRAIYRNARYLPAEKHPEFGFWKRCFDAE